MVLEDSIHFVIPVEAGIHSGPGRWMPVKTGMTNLRLNLKRQNMVSEILKTYLPPQREKRNKIKKILYKCTEQEDRDQRFHSFYTPVTVVGPAQSCRGFSISP